MVSGVSVDAGCPSWGCASALRSCTGSVPDVDGVLPSGRLYPPNPLPRTSLGGTPLLFPPLSNASPPLVVLPWRSEPLGVLPPLGVSLHGGTKDSVYPLEALDAGMIPPP